MNAFSGNQNGPSSAYWYCTSKETPVRPPLDQNLGVDVCVIGAGVAGLSCAYELSRQGRSVIVLDQGDVGGGETGRSTAHLSSAVDDRFSRIEALHGMDRARICYESHAAAIRWFADVIHRENIACDFEQLDGYLFRPPGEAESVITTELDAAHRAGMSEARLVARAPLPAFDTGVAIRFPHQAQCDPLALVNGLAAACERKGVRIFSGTHVESLERPGKVQCSLGVEIEANAIIVATNAPINNLISIPLRQSAYRTYAIAMPVTRGTIPRALYWDSSQEPGDAGGAYHYARFSGRGGADGSDDAVDEFLLVGGEDHKTGQANDAVQRWGRLARWANERFPVSGPVVSRWSGQVMEPVDGIAFIGRSPSMSDGVFMVTGDSGMGITHAAIGAILISDLMAGRSNSWESLYDPARKTIASLPRLVGEAMNTAVQYFDWLSPGDVENKGAIRSGEGAIVRDGIRLLACYRDRLGRLHVRSAVCPHLGGIVHWNAAESSWDCPCHGSRFSCMGEVICGPAVSNLGNVKDGIHASHTTVK